MEIFETDAELDAWLRRTRWEEIEAVAAGQNTEAEADMDTPSTRAELEAHGIDEKTVADMARQVNAGAVNLTVASHGLARLVALAAARGTPITLSENPTAADMAKLGELLETISREEGKRHAEAEAARAESGARLWRKKGNKGKFAAAVAKRRAKGKAERKAARRGGKGRR